MKRLFVYFLSSSKLISFGSLFLRGWLREESRFIGIIFRWPVLLTSVHAVLLIFTTLPLLWNDRSTTFEDSIVLNLMSDIASDDEQPPYFYSVNNKVFLSAMVEDSWCCRKARIMMRYLSTSSRSEMRRPRAPVRPLADSLSNWYIFVS